LQDSDYKKRRTQRYESFDEGPGAKFEAGKLNMEDLCNLAKSQGPIEPISGKQELFENIINQYV
jgi:xylose isomerase